MGGLWPLRWLGLYRRDRLVWAISRCHADIRHGQAVKEATAKRERLAAQLEEIRVEMAAAVQINRD